MIFNVRSSSSSVIVLLCAIVVLSSYSSNIIIITIIAVVFLLLLLLLLLLCRPSFVRFSPLYQTMPLSSFDVIFISSPPHIIGVLFSAVNKGSKKRCSPRRRPRTTPRGRFWWRYEHDHHTPGEPTPKRQKRDFGRRRHEYYVPKVITFLGTTSMKRSMTTMH